MNNCYISSHRQCSLEDGGFGTLVPEAFHAWFPVSVKSLKVTFAARNFGLRPKKCRPVADEMTRETHARKKPLVPRVGIWGPLLEA